MLKPASSNCNLACEYCFYHSLSSKRTDFSKGFMSDDTAKRVVDSALEFADSTDVYFTFQGGEPLLHQRIAVEPLRDVLPDNVAHRADVALRPVGQHRQRLHCGCPDLRRGVYLDGLRVKLGLPGNRVRAVGGEIHRAAVR